jgi:CBS domain-containing protein
MKNVPVCVSPDTDVFTVSSIFSQQGFRHLPVVSNSYLLGVVSRRDILRGLKDYHLKTQRIQASERKRPDLLKILMNRRLIIR